MVSSGHGNEIEGTEKKDKDGFMKVPEQLEIPLSKNNCKQCKRDFVKRMEKLTFKIF